MDRPTVRQATGRHRRWTFVLWVALTVVALGALIVATPIVFMAPGNGAWLGYFVPPLMFVLLASGIGWLGWVSLARRPPPDMANDQRTARAPRG